MGEGGGARSAPVWGNNKLKKTGARSARARTRGKNPLVLTYSNKFYTFEILQYHHSELFCFILNFRKFGNALVS